MATTKLQNLPPPRQPALSFSPPPASAAIHHDPPQPVRATHVPQNSTSSQYSNPFRTPKHTPHNSGSSSQPFSPVSPIEEQADNRFQLPAGPKSSSHPKMSGEQPRKPVDLRTIDGKPYPTRQEEHEQKPRKVKVAQDMYAGDQPPSYDPKGFSGSLPTKVGHACQKCGGHKKGQSTDAAIVSPEKPVKSQNVDCGKCGGRKSTPPSSYPRAAMAPTRPQQAPHGNVASSSEAGPSNAPRTHQHNCGKCGRRKRPDSISTTASSSEPRSPQVGASFTNVPQLQTNGMPTIGINIEPPTAITERAPTLPFSPASTVGETPLVRPQSGPQQAKGHKPSRSGSISSLFRSFSRRKKSMDQPLPSQQLVANGEQSTIVDKISNAMRGDDNAAYARLRPDDYPQRPGSPFSFIDKPQEEQSFEMNDMRKSKQPERRDSWDRADESTTFITGNRPRYSRSQSTRTNLTNDQGQDDVYLALPADQRPGITRFKSLRAGVNRAAGGLQRSASQVSRSPSLRRLESVKKVPELWYRDTEGPQGEYNLHAY